MLDTELLLKVKEQILREPERFDMDDFAIQREGCGTVCCIAGWAYWLKHGFHMHANMPHFKAGADAIGIDEGSAGDLFEYGLWPAEWVDLYDEADDDAERAAVAASLIDEVVKRKSVWWAPNE